MRRRSFAIVRVVRSAPCGLSGIQERTGRGGSAASCAMRAAALRVENVSTEEDTRSRGVGREPLARSSSSRLRLIVRRRDQWRCGGRRATKLTGEQLGAYAALLR